MAKVSVITTFYNAERFLDKALFSVYAQDIDGFDLEYIIVDDWSTDGSIDIATKYINLVKGRPNCEWKIVKPSENLGCGGARRFGIENASGDYFMFLDADDYYINKDFIKRAVNDLTKENADIVEYGMIMNQGNGQQINNVASQKFVIENHNAAEIALFKDNLIKFNVWTKIYCRKIVESFTYSDERTFEDVRTIPIWVYNAKKIVIMPSLEINYRAASNSIIRNNWLDTRLGTIKAIASHFELFKNNIDILKAMYQRAMVDLTALLHNHSSENEGFNEMSKLNTYMLKYIYPETYKNITYNIDDIGDKT